MAEAPAALASGETDVDDRNLHDDGFRGARRLLCRRRQR
jgi:hypothetical protein